MQKVVRNQQFCTCCRSWSITLTLKVNLKKRLEPESLCGSSLVHGFIDLFSINLSCIRSDSYHNSYYINMYKCRMVSAGFLSMLPFGVWQGAEHNKNTTKPLFSFFQNSKTLQDSTSHRIFECMHEVLNIAK